LDVGFFWQTLIYPLSPLYYKK